MLSVGIGPGEYCGVPEVVNVCLNLLHRYNTACIETCAAMKIRITRTNSPQRFITELGVEMCGNEAGKAGYQDARRLIFSAAREYETDMMRLSEHQKK